MKKITKFRNTKLRNLNLMKLVYFWYLGNDVQYELKTFFNKFCAPIFTEIEYDIWNSFILQTFSPIRPTSSHLDSQTTIFCTTKFHNHFFLFLFFFFIGIQMSLSMFFAYQDQMLSPTTSMDCLHLHRRIICVTEKDFRNKL